LKAAESAKSQIYRIKGVSLSPSIGELVDCVYMDGSGCEGGFEQDVYTYMADGVAKEENYPVTMIAFLLI
jgi:hypothetical protein